ncbi:MAG: sporulation integral membrane protein YlbJ, partial [Bacillota bacterium]
MPYLFASAVMVFFFYLLYRRRLSLPRYKQHLVTCIIACCAVFITLSLVRYPKEAFEASVAGLEVWWHIVFPALLPFFVFAQILIGLGVVHMIGVFLEPVMRPVFNVPGTGAFVMAMGLASGFPIGAVLTAELRSRELCNRFEAERLLSFTNTADPLFMFGAVAVGMLGYPEAGMTIAVAHYLSSLTVGVGMRFYRRREAASPERGLRRGSILARALRAMIAAREEDGRPLGRLMGDAITKSVDTLLLIGGFIILFSVIIRILDLLGVVAFLSGGLVYLLNLSGLSPALAPALISGIFEIDLGCQFSAALSGVAMGEKIIAAGMIIAWSGLSVHAQVASIISRTDIKM